jgi:hypothetical protein
MLKTKKGGFRAYDVIGILLAAPLVMVSVWLTAERGWFFHGNQGDLFGSLRLVLVGMLLFLAACLAIPGKRYEKPLFRGIGFVATIVCLGSNVLAVTLSLAMVIFGVVGGALLSDWQDAFQICVGLVLGGVGILVGACYFLGSGLVLRRKLDHS